MACVDLDGSTASLALPLTHHERLQRIAAAEQNVISFAGGLPDARLFPRKQFAAAFLRSLESPQALQYGWPEGSARLRERVAHDLRARGAHVAAEQVLITSGAQQALTIAIAALARPGFAIGFESETYPGALDAAKARGARIVPLEQDARAYYVMPAIGNPRGKPMLPNERDQLLARAKRLRAFVIEDDAYAETTFEGEPPAPLLAAAPDRVFHVGTFSKTLCPGLRLGWLVAPERFQRRVLEAKQSTDLQSTGLSQAVLEVYLASGHFSGLKRRLRKHYARRARLLARAVHELLPDFRFDLPKGGFSLWLESELRESDERLLELAVAEGVSFDLGSAFRRDSSPQLTLRLSYSLVEDEQIVPGVVSLARAVARLKRASAP